MSTAIHWYYPSLVVGCGLDFDSLPSEQITDQRGDVTCELCERRLATDRLICAGCRGQSKRHICNPDTVTDSLGDWLRGGRNRQLLLEWQPLGPHWRPAGEPIKFPSGGPDAIVAAELYPHITTEERLRIAMGGQFIARIIESGHRWAVPQTSSNVSAAIDVALAHVKRSES